MNSDNHYDAIIIGSGMGGLTVGSLLAKLADKRVLILEQHDQIGGFTHTFRRRGYEWDVGLHYVGEMGAHTLIRKLFDTVLGSDVSWNKMPADFDWFIYPNFIVKVPDDWKLYQKRLQDQFPHQKNNIKKYFLVLEKVVAWYKAMFMIKMFSNRVGSILNFLNFRGRKYATLTTAHVLDLFITDNELKEVLVSQAGDYGLSPRDSAFAIHALVTYHYSQGGYYPEGGASRLAKSVELEIERKGGHIVPGYEVNEILVENGEVQGVQGYARFENKKFTLYAPLIISNLGIVNTSRLMPHSSYFNQLMAAAKKLDHFSYSAVIMYMGLADSPKNLGIEGQNLWVSIKKDFEIEELKKLVSLSLPETLYISFPSMKAGAAHNHTAEVFLGVSPHQFNQYAPSTWRERPKSYDLLKKTLCQILLRMVERYVPGLKNLVVYSELATPLTVNYFDRAHLGALYGIPATPARYDIPHLTPQTPYKNLFLSGCDIGSLGVAGAALGGMLAVSKILGVVRTQRGLRFNTVKTVQSSDWSAADFKPKYNLYHAQLLEKNEISKDTYEVVFKLNDNFNFQPGQFARWRVSKYDWREYSIVRCDGDKIYFLVDTKSIGIGAQYIKNLELGSTTVMRMPFGYFTLKRQQKNIIFIATGTGLSPLLPMINLLKNDISHTHNVELIFGCRTREYDFLKHYKSQLSQVKTVVCLDEERVDDTNYFNGRITNFLSTRDIIAEDTEFYICGLPAMVNSVFEYLNNLGFPYIYRELY